MKYPRHRGTEIVQFAEFDCRQVNLHVGSKFCYWFIQPETQPIKTRVGEIPVILKNKIIGKLANWSGYYGTLQIQLHEAVDKFNRIFKIGDKVEIKLGFGEIKYVTVKDAASILGEHSAVGWFEEIIGCYSLDNIIDKKYNQ